MRKDEEIKTRIIVENESNRYIWESPFFDNRLEDIIEAVYGLLVASTWHPDSVARAMKEFGEEHLPNEEEENEII